MAKKAFKRLRITALPPRSKPGFSTPDAAAELRAINLLLLSCAGVDAQARRPARKAVASRGLAVALAMGRIAFIVQRFLRITW
jgi:hypothetical protein